jgi:hypothetical protein
MLSGHDEDWIKTVFNKLGEDIHQNAINKGFWPLCVENNRITEVDYTARNKGEMIALMHSELCEMLEAIRFDKKQSLVEPSDGKIIQVDSNGIVHLMDEHCSEFTSEEIELADLSIRALDYASAYKLRLGEAILAKHEYNKTREYKHGKAF